MTTTIMRPYSHMERFLLRLGFTKALPEVIVPADYGLEVIDDAPATPAEIISEYEGFKARKGVGIPELERFKFEFQRLGSATVQQDIGD